MQCTEQPTCSSTAAAFLTRPADGIVGVNLKSKSDETTEAELDALAGEFSNELLNQAIRVPAGESTATLREYMMARAFFTTPVQSSIDALLAEPRRRGA